MNNYLLNELMLIFTLLTCLLAALIRLVTALFKTKFGLLGREEGKVVSNWEDTIPLILSDCHATIHKFVWSIAVSLKSNGIGSCCLQS